MEHVLLAWLCLGTSFADSSQNIKPWSDLRIFTNRDQELELTMKDAVTIEHLLVEDVVSDGLSVCSLARRKTTAAKSPEKRYRWAKSKYNPALLGSASVVESFWSMVGKVLTKEQSSMRLLIFEFIIYLKYKSDLWGVADVIEANKCCKNATTPTKACALAHKQRVSDWIHPLIYSGTSENCLNNPMKIYFRRNNAYYFKGV